MFMGEYQHSLDEKGRLIIPAKFREGLGEKFILNRGLDNCLYGYPVAEWKVIEEKIKEFPTSHPDYRAFVRLFFSGAVDVEMDKQGRIIIPQHLREHAHIEKDVYVIGLSTKVEIWAKEAWEQYSEKVKDSYEGLAASIINLGI
ncbi:MAG: division/cell wall cluster transcriptional repressor MraZ [Firmicutes bacterium]|nr:division/cell wall cluster transcriptional repressor MraZ [Bacillota bacterium]